NSRDQQHPRTDTKQEQGSAVIASCQNQYENRSDEGRGKSNAARERSHLPPISLAVVRQGHDEREFGELGRLNRHNLQVEPALCAFDLLPDAWDQHQQKQHYRKSEQEPRNPFEMLVSI